MIKVITVLLLLTPLFSIGQKQRKFDTSFADITFKEFFLRNPEIQSLQFSSNYQSQQSVSVYFKPDTAKRRYQYYKLDFIGDKFLFEKQYGSLTFPNKDIQAALKNKCKDSYYADLTATPDSLKLHLTYYCYNKKRKADDEMIFTKITIYGGYKGGAQQLKKRIQSAMEQNYNPINHSLKDSVLIYQIVIDSKDSCLKEVKLYYGEESFFNRFILQELKKACNWEPPMAGGLPVKAYRKIYVKLESDHTITVAYPEG